jgi:O-antigen/teichoic acid export membrane protein
MESQIGLIQLGLFVAGYSISAGFIYGFESILTAYYQPRLYRDVSYENPLQQVSAWQAYASTIIPSLMLTVAFVIMLAPELTRLFLGEKFQTAAEYLVWGGLAEAARVLIGAYSLIAHVFMRTSWLIIPNVIGASLSIILCAMLIPKYGAAGAGIALVSSGFAVVLVMHILLAQHVAGGFSIRYTLISIIFASALWLLAIGIRPLLSGTGQWSYILQIILIGIPFLALQYFLLRNSIISSRLSRGV